MQQKTLLKIKGKELLRKDLFDYKIFEIIPSRFIETSPKALEEILNTMVALYEDKLKYDYLNKSLVYVEQNPIFYEIFYKGKTVRFHYIIPDKYSRILSNKIDKVYRTATIKEIEEDYFPNFFNKYYCSFSQKKHFVFSLNSDYREHGLLDGLMSVLNNIQENDNIMLQIGIIPQNDNWKEQWKMAYLKHKNGEDLTINPNPVFFLMDNFMKFSESILGVFDNIIGIEKETKEYEKIQRHMDRMGQFRNSHMTTGKINYNGYQVQIRVYCDNEERARYYSKIFDGVFKILDADQELELGRIKIHKSKKREFNYQISKNIWSTKEVAHFLRLPDRRMQLDYRESMKPIEVTENKVPKELKNGKILIGFATYKGEKIPIYFNTKDFHMATQHKIICGLQRTGKSTYLKSYAIDAMKAGHSVFIIDTIKTTELADDVRDFLPPEYQDKLIILDFANFDYCLPLAWNELLNANAKTNRERMMISSHIASNLEAFIDSVGGITQEEKLSPRMKKFLACSAKLVFSQPNTNIKDVLDVLQDRGIRDQFIESSGLPESNIIVQELRRLDNPKGGTNYDLIKGISDRYSILTNDYTMEHLLSLKPNPEINFTKWANEGKCVLIKLSDLKFGRTSLQSMVSFIYSKIWLSMLARGNVEQPKVTHVILDEIHNFPSVFNMLNQTCRESAKFGLSYVFTNHMLTDLKNLLLTLKASGANFMLYKTTKENYKKVEEELMQGDVSIEEAMETKPFHSINIINFNREYCVLTTKSPDEIEKRYKKYDRTYLDTHFSKKFGTEWTD